MDIKKHSLSLDTRSKLSITAVDDVLSFDETLVSLSVGSSVLNISGEELSITNLSLENGDVSLSGKISAMVYFDEAPRKKRLGFFGR